MIYSNAKVGYIGNNKFYQKPFGTRMQAVVDFATAQGYDLPPLTSQFKMDDFLISIESIIAKHDVFYLLCGDGSINFKLINIVNPSGGIIGTAYGGLTWNNYCVQGSTTGYIDIGTPFSGLTNYALTNASVTIYVYTAYSGGGYYIVGHSTGSASTLISNANAVYQRVNSNTTNVGTSINFSGTGLMNLNRNGTTLTAYKNGTLISTQTLSANAVLNNNGTILKHAATYSNAAASLFGLGAELTADDNTLLQNQLANYLV